jgi:hypothetical protein
LKKKSHIQPPFYVIGSYSPKRQFFQNGASTAELTRRRVRCRVPQTEPGSVCQPQKTGRKTGQTAPNCTVLPDFLGAAGTGSRSFFKPGRTGNRSNRPGSHWFGEPWCGVPAPRTPTNASKQATNESAKRSRTDHETYIGVKTRRVRACMVGAIQYAGAASLSFVLLLGEL